MTYTVTVPCFSPVGREFGKISSVCSGRALVQISQSCGCTPRIMSRTQPPTRYAAWPRDWSVIRICFTYLGGLTFAIYTLLV